MQVACIAAEIQYTPSRKVVLADMVVDLVVCEENGSFRVHVLCLAQGLVELVLDQGVIALPLGDGDAAPPGGIFVLCFSVEGGDIIVSCSIVHKEWCVVAGVVGPIVDISFHDCLCDGDLTFSTAESFFQGFKLWVV